MPKVWNAKGWIKKVLKIIGSGTAILTVLGWLFGWWSWADHEIRANAADIHSNRELEDQRYHDLSKTLDHIQSTTDRLLDLQLRHR